MRTFAVVAQKRQKKWADSYTHTLFPPSKVIHNEYCCLRRQREQQTNMSDSTDRRAGGSDLLKHPLNEWELRSDHSLSIISQTVSWLNLGAARLRWLDRKLQHAGKHWASEHKQCSSVSCVRHWQLLWRLEIMYVIHDRHVTCLTVMYVTWQCTFQQIFIGAD